MAYDMTWHTDKRIVMIRIYGELTADELIAINRKTGDYVEDGIPFVHLVLDVRDLEKYPKLGDATKIDFATYDEVGWTIIVGASAILKFISSIVVQVTGARYRMVSDVDEAIAFLQTNDSSLSEKLAC